MVFLCLAGLGLCAWLIVRSHENLLPREGGQKFVQKRRHVAAHTEVAQGGKGSTVATGQSGLSPRLTVSRITTPGPTPSVPNHSLGECPFRKSNLSGKDIKRYVAKGLKYG